VDIVNRIEGEEFLMLRKLFSRENILALLICLAVISLIILTTGQAPQWIYQGF
jgi:hypothetical protein